MRFKLALAAICAVAFVLPAGGHHSHGNYSEEFTDLDGVVTELHLLVPHSWLYIEVEGPDGEPQIWALEASDRNHLAESGITRGYLQPGDTVKARCHPVRDGSPGCLLGFLKDPDGNVKDWDGNNAPAPDDF